MAATKICCRHKLLRMSSFRFFYTLALVGLLSTFVFGQSEKRTAYTFKGGLSIGTQRWNAFSNRSPLFRYHGDLVIETADSDEFGIFAQLGYHVRGSAVRYINLSAGANTNFISRPFAFHNLAVGIGGKQRFGYRNIKAYYLIALRGEYTVWTNLGRYEDENNVYLFLPIEGLVRRFNYGVTAGGGFEWSFGDLVGGILEFTVSPDFSYQYRQPPLQNVPSPYISGVFTDIPEREIRNLSFEISLGIRFLRIVEYID